MTQDRQRQVPMNNILKLCYREEKITGNFPKGLKEANASRRMKNHLLPVVRTRWCLIEIRRWDAGIEAVTVPVHFHGIPRLPLNQNEAHNVHSQAEKNVENHREQQRWGDQPSCRPERHQLRVGTIQVHYKINSSCIFVRAGKCSILHQKNSVASWAHPSKQIDKLKYIVFFEGTKQWMDSNSSHMRKS